MSAGENFLTNPPVLVDLQFLKAACERLDGNDEKRGIGEYGNLLRVLKIAEELGEVTALIIKKTGQNPRKANQPVPSNGNVRDELFDVALTALVAAYSFQPYPDKAVFGSVATEQMAWKLRRLFES